MFKRKVLTLKEILMENIRKQGLETPLLKRRMIDAWPIVAGPVISRYTQYVSIRNQTIFVHLSSPALRADLSMQRSVFVKRLNEYVGAFLISDIRFQ